MRKFALIVGLATFLFSNSLGTFGQEGTKVCPCCSEKYLEFDFWVGDWVVYAKGKMAGFNKITKIEDGCILRENWKSVETGYTGTSYNFYDKIDGKWKQVWVDNQGTVVELSGNYSDNKMVLESEIKIDSEGNRIINRITWFNNDDGTVRQLWEQSNDGGHDFTTTFDGLYRRRK